MLSAKEHIVVLSGILLFSRSLTPITVTYHKHLSSARFFAVLYPSHIIIIIIIINDIYIAQVRKSKHD